MLEHERALEIARAVKPGCQAEVPLEQGTQVTETIDNVRSVLSHLSIHGSSRILGRWRFHGQSPLGQYYD